MVNEKKTILEALANFGGIL